MIKKNIVFAILFFVSTINAQDKDEVLFSIDGENVYNAEFIRVYQKNKDIIVDKEEKEFTDYFDLFVDFKLKLKQAHDIKLDTSLNYLDELSKYRAQLVTPYLQNEEATEFLMKQAYDRTVTEVRASHILVKVLPNAKPKDTLLAYQKITEARRQINDGKLFEEVAKQFSEDPSVNTNGGDLGYFSAFSMVYPFENAAYSTNEGEVSLPFKTQFGYHILQVTDKRKSLGELEVAHIMVKNKEQDTSYAKIKIFDIYNKLKQGDDFSKIAIEHSDDQSSAKKGGVLPRFGTGRMIKPFEDVAFSLKNEGDFSEPFKTRYGWHILQLIKKYPVKTYDELYDYLKSKINGSTRSGYVEKTLAEELAKKYTISENKKILSAFYQQEEAIMTSDSILIAIEEEAYAAKEFYDVLLKEKNKNIDEVYLDFKNGIIIDYYKDHLEYTNEAFANTYQEYRDGLLLFELLQKNIWDKADKDTIGLEQYYNANKDKYFWKKRAQLNIASCTDQAKALLVKKYLAAGKSTEEIKELVNEGATIHVLFSSGKLEEGSSKLPKNYTLKEGVSDIYQDEDHHYTIVRVLEIIPPSVKELKDTRGEVVNDYQNYLEEVWVKELREIYKVKINKRNYHKLKRNFEQL